MQYFPATVGAAVTVGAALGIENANEMRDNVEEELSPEEIIEEQDNAEKFFKDFVNKNN